MQLGKFFQIVAEGVNYLPCCIESIFNYWGTHSIFYHKNLFTLPQWYTTILVTLNPISSGEGLLEHPLFWFGCHRKKRIDATPFYVLTFQVNTPWSFAFISLSDPELWALKVKWWANFLSMKTFEGQNCRIFCFFLIAPVALLDIFFYFFLYRLKECVLEYIE